MAIDSNTKVDFDLQSARRIDRAVLAFESDPDDRSSRRSRVTDTTLKITANRGKSGCYEAVEVFAPTIPIDTTSGTLAMADIGTVLSTPQIVEVLNPYEVGLNSHVLAVGDLVSAEPHGVTTERKRLFKVRNCLTAGDCGGG